MAWPCKPMRPALRSLPLKDYESVVVSLSDVCCKLRSVVDLEEIIKYNIPAYLGAGASKSL